MKNRITPQEAALELFKTKYSGAKCIFLAGSVIRGEASKYSDLDLVVVYEKLEFAYRDSYIFNDWPVEAFVHDPQTLKYFFEEVDGPSGCPSLVQMVIEGLTIPEAESFTEGLKEYAQSEMGKGPSLWGQDAVDRARYGITDLIDDLREPINHSEAIGSAARLYDVLADFYFRSQGKWSAKGKTIDRKLKELDPVFAKEFYDSFNLLYSKNDSSSVVSLAEKILLPYGGFLFDGHRLDAPESWRK